MSTRGCIVKLNREKCEIDYIHHCLDLIIILFYKSNGYFTSDEVQEMIKEETETCPDHIDIIDKNLIDRLFQYDTNIIEMETEIVLFVEDKGHYIDLTLKWHESKGFDKNYRPDSFCI